jgi:hypothetical protein
LLPRKYSNRPSPDSFWIDGILDSTIILFKRCEDIYCFYYFAHSSQRNKVSTVFGPAFEKFYSPSPHRSLEETGVFLIEWMIPVGCDFSGFFVEFLGYLVELVRASTCYIFSANNYLSWIIVYDASDLCEVFVRIVAFH